MVNDEEGLEMENLTQNELTRLYINFCHYRDNKCNGYSDMSVQEYFIKYGAGSHA